MCKRRELMHTFVLKIVSVSIVIVDSRTKPWYATYGGMALKKYGSTNDQNQCFCIKHKDYKHVKKRNCKITKNRLR